MARVVYGSSGEGSGHSSRSREMMRHLLAAGHELLGVSYDRGYRNLKDEFELIEVEGRAIRTVDKKVSVVKTFTDNLSRLSEGVRSLRLLRDRAFRDFRPHCVITDFEPMTAYRARLEAYPRSDNSAITTRLDELLAGEGALAREYHRRRRGEAREIPE